MRHKEITDIGQYGIAVFVLGVDQHSYSAGQYFNDAHTENKEKRSFPSFSIRGQRYETLNCSRMNAQWCEPLKRRAYGDGPKGMSQKRIWVHPE